MKALLAVGLGLLLVPAAHAEEVTRLDRDHGVRFTLNGPVLAVGLEPQQGHSPPDIREYLWGKQVRAACSPVFSFRARKLRRALVTGVGLWPEGQLELTYTFGRDISDRVKWCMLEAVDGGDLASAGFVPFIRIYADSPRERRTGRRLRRHLLQHGAERPWFPEALGIVMTDGITALSTDLPRTRRARRTARRLCALIAGSGVPVGMTAVYGRNDVRLRACGRVRPPAP